MSEKLVKFDHNKLYKDVKNNVIVILKGNKITKVK